MEKGPTEPPTRWTLIVRAQGSGAEARAALGELLGRYERFVLWLIRHFGYPPDLTLEDLKQEFFAGVLRRDDIGKLDPKRGKFRAWLVVAVRRFLFNEWDKWHADAAGRKLTSAALFEAFHRSTPEDELCIRAFAEHTLARALDAQRAEARDPKRFDVIARFLPGPQMDFVELGPLARSLGMKPTALAKAISVTRSRYREVLRTTIRDTLDLDPDPPPGPSGAPPGIVPEARGGVGDASLEAAWERAVDDELGELLRSFSASERAGVITEPT